MAIFKEFAFKKILEIGWIKKVIPKCGSKEVILKPIYILPYTSNIHTVWERIIDERIYTVLAYDVSGTVVEVLNLVTKFKTTYNIIVLSIAPGRDNKTTQLKYLSQILELLCGWKFSNFKNEFFGEIFNVNLVDENLTNMHNRLSYYETSILVNMCYNKVVSENTNLQLYICVFIYIAIELSAIISAKLLAVGKLFVVCKRFISIKIAKKYESSELINYGKGSIDVEVKKLTGVIV